MKTNIPILLIDDEVRVLELLKTSLEAYGFAVSVASSGKQAIELAIVSPPQAIILDMCMPGMDGYEVLSRLRNHATTRAIPVIAISANAMHGDPERGRREGFTEYLTKPLDIPRFLETLDSYYATRLNV